MQIKSIMGCRTSRVVLCDDVLPAEAALTLQREGGLDLRPQLLVDQRVVPAVQSGPGGNSLPAQRTAQRGFIHRLQETALAKHGALQHQRSGSPALYSCLFSPVHR